MKSLIYIVIFSFLVAGTTMTFSISPLQASEESSAIAAPGSEQALDSDEEKAYYEEEATPEEETDSEEIMDSDEEGDMGSQEEMSDEAEEDMEKESY